MKIAAAPRWGRHASASARVSFSLGREKLGIVGESGSGKSLSGRALLGVLPPYARMSVDRMQFDGIDLKLAKETDPGAKKLTDRGLIPALKGKPALTCMCIVTSNYAKP